MKQNVLYCDNYEKNQIHRIYYTTRVKENIIFKINLIK